MPIQFGAIVVSAVVGVVVNSVADNLTTSGPRNEINIDSLNTFLQLISKDFSNKVEEIVRMSFLKYDLKELQRNALVAADAYKDFTNKPTEKQYLSRAEESARDMYSRIVMLDKEIADINSDFDLDSYPEEDLKRFRLKITFLKLLIVACSLDLLIVGALQIDDKPDKKIIDRSKEYFQILERLLKNIKKPFLEDWDDIVKVQDSIVGPQRVPIMDEIFKELNGRIKSFRECCESVDLKRIQIVMEMLRGISLISPTPFPEESWWKEFMTYRKKFSESEEFKEFAKSKPHMFRR